MKRLLRLCGYWIRKANDVFFFALAMDRAVLRSNILLLEEPLLRSSIIDPFFERSRISCLELCCGGIDCE